MLQFLSHISGLIFPVSVFLRFRADEPLIDVVFNGFSRESGSGNDFMNHHHNHLGFEDITVPWGQVKKKAKIRSELSERMRDHS